MAVMPVPNMVPRAITKLSRGYTIFTAEKASVPTSLDTNIPSTTVYRDITTIMTMEGRANFRIEGTVIFLSSP